MAEEKKSKSVAEHQTDSKTIEQIITILALFLLLGAVANALLNYIDNLGLGASGSLWARTADYFLLHIWPLWRLIAVIVSVLAFIGIIYNSWKLAGINAAENLIFNSIPGVSDLNEEDVIEEKNDKWEQIIKYTNSENPSDWRQAIIEADVMLEELLRATGYEGESVGEMLKSVDKSDFLTIEDAWEAHKIRNAIAHSGGDFQLNEHETKRVITLFEKVFEEFNVI